AFLVSFFVRPEDRFFVPTCACSRTARAARSRLKSLPSAVITANVLIHSPDAGSFQFSHRPAMPNGEPAFSEKTFGARRDSSGWEWDQMAAGRIGRGWRASSSVRA